MYVLSTVYRDPTVILQHCTTRARAHAAPFSRPRICGHTSGPPQPSRCPHCTNYALQLLWPTSLRQGGPWATRGSRGAHTGVSASGAPGPTWQGPPNVGTHVHTHTHTSHRGCATCDGCKREAGVRVLKSARGSVSTPDWQVGGCPHAVRYVSRALIQGPEGGQGFGCFVVTYRVSLDFLELCVLR